MEDETLRKAQGDMMKELLCPWCQGPVVLLSDNKGSVAKIYFCVSCHKDFAGPLDMQRECQSCAHRGICRVFFALQRAHQRITELLSRELGASCIHYEVVRRG